MTTIFRELFPDMSDEQLKDFEKIFAEHGDISSMTQEEIADVIRAVLDDKLES